ncbi:hypothetical protein DF3PB_220035 [uncultured Defluviicoccus sp.]|uniref:Uncharacterized protein n=1 Tax=metagenome TaxID=256318 RepID=A0A380TE67_9ZZZZ|nr:hypothetical protein DF3PB_220035 [uncultured Defluviicoccus sp.]
MARASVAAWPDRVPRCQPDADRVRFRRRGFAIVIGAILLIGWVAAAQATTPAGATLPCEDDASLDVDFDLLLRSPSDWNGKDVAVFGIATPTATPGALQLRRGRDAGSDAAGSIRLSFDYGPYAASEAEMRKALGLQDKPVVVRGVFAASGDGGRGGKEIRFICSIESWPALEERRPVPRDGVGEPAATIADGTSEGWVPLDCQWRRSGRSGAGNKWPRPLTAPDACTGPRPRQSMAVRDRVPSSPPIL